MKKAVQNARHNGTGTVAGRHRQVESQTNAIRSALRCGRELKFDAFPGKRAAPLEPPLGDAVHGKGKKCSKHENIGDLRRDAWRKRAERSIRGSRHFWGKWLRNGKGSPKKKGTRKASWPFVALRPTPATRLDLPEPLLPQITFGAAVLRLRSKAARDRPAEIATKIRLRLSGGG
jgi:hypothetical protein